MARANLVVDEELRVAFVAALQNDTPLRWLKAELDDVHIKLVDHGPVRGSAQADLDELKEGALRGSGPCFVLFCLNPEADKMAWVLIAFVPDNSKVRARMLYASGQEDVKRTLGFSNFAGSVHATEVDDLDLDLMRGNVKRNLEDAPLTEEELLAKEEVAQMAAPGDARANGMGMVPFQFEAALDAKLKEFAAGSCDLVEAKVLSDEQVGLGSVSGSALNAGNIARGEPRFYFFRAKPSKRVYFVFSCPTSTKIRLRMTYSTCKPTIAHHVAELGIDVDKSLEVGDPEDIDDLIKLHDVQDEDQGKIVQQNISKPARPGRGKARILKKQ